jgi:hypothetical protein
MPVSTRTCLLIPDMCATGGNAKGLDGWRASLISGLLISRHNSGKGQTIIAMNSMDAFKRDYGQMLSQHVQSHYVQMGNQ